MKYEFKILGIDEYELIYTSKDKEEKKIKFKRTIEIANKLQSIEKRARLKMFKDLTEMGMTKDDLIVKREENGKKIYDESNYKAYEENYLNLARFEIINEVFEICLKMPITDLLIDMGIEETTDPKSVETFSNKFASIIIGKNNQEQSPSGK